MADDTQDPTMGDVLSLVAKQEGGPEGLKFLGDLMEHQRRIDDQVIHGLAASWEREAERWKARAIRAEAELKAIELRLDWIRYGSLPFGEA